MKKVKCINQRRLCNRITVGKIYEVKDEFYSDYWYNTKVYKLKKDDFGREGEYLAEDFIEI
ncbi:hypothetical protein ACSW9O_15680 (plasmid) [Clostridium perfringens]|nr:hypothetical protein [Clostridium perfringens]